MVENKYEKYLPIGTIVMLKNATKPIMIIGYLYMGNDNVLYDYSAVIIPEGKLSSEQTLVFNHEQINEVVVMGCTNSLYNNFNKNLLSIDEDLRKKLVEIYE